MKALVILFAFFLSHSAIQANSADQLKKKKPQTSQNHVAQQVGKEINRHIFNPSAQGADIKGEAAVMLEMMPEGNLKVVTIQTQNPLLQKFIERQVKKMKIDSDELVVGELFRYKLVFKAQ